MKSAHIPFESFASICCRKVYRLMPKIFLDRFHIDSWGLRGEPGGEGGDCAG
jgi:hypothetical protein